MAKIKYLVDEVRDGRYVRAYKVGRDIAVQIWNKATPEGEPDGDWEMPGMLGVEVSISQAMVQTNPG